MDINKAIKIAVAAIEAEIQKICFDANMHDKYKATYPVAVKSSKRRKDLLEAIRLLKGVVEHAQSK